tara:strand:- start:7388 stop:7840 length:453 start_codon:yes stop_codon:yes gene_type:complete
MKKDKRLSRCTALQILYSAEIANNDPVNSFNYVLENSDDENFSSKVKEYTLQLVNHSQQNVKYLDELICKKSKNWEISRIAMIDIIILRMAIAEMLFIEEIPLKVSIAEAIEIAKIFSTKDSGRFVNGILDSIYKDIVKGKIGNVNVNFN